MYCSESLNYKKNVIIVSDFDGTITTKDGLYSFIAEHASSEWEDIEQAWVEGKISSKECLRKELELVPNLTDNLITEFASSVEIDESFKTFYEKITKKGIDFCIVSDGIDYFIKKILDRYGLDNIKVISNTGYFRGGNFELEFPNDFTECKNNAGTCKCKVVSDLRQKYNKIVYIGDGVSDYCVSDKADILYAKSSLLNYCKQNHIQCLPFITFKDIKIEL